MSKPPQPDLYAAKLDDFQPLEGDGPRLWIKRLAIWSSPQEEPFRDIPLRPGLNIVWSPDADGEGKPMGHGGGKSSFCRLIRYCLGEDSFGTDVQRQRIASAMPDALVGAEVMLDGELWNVIRPIGAGAGTGSHCAVKGGSLNALIQGEIPNPTMRPLREAIAKAVMPTSWPNMPGGSSADDAWEAALAWMTRDQERRLLDILEWRAPETQSRSPSRRMSKDDRLKVVRLLLKTLQQNEINAVARAQGHKQRADEAARRKQRVEQVRDDVARGLHQMFGGEPDDNASPTLWANKAKAEASAAMLKTDPQIEQKLGNARGLVEEKNRELREAEKRASDADAALPEVIETLRILDGQVPRAKLVLQDASDPLCPTCHQKWPSNKQTLIEEQTSNLNELVEARDKADERRQHLLSEQQVGKSEAALARQNLDHAKATLTALEQTAKETAQALASATGYVTLTSRYPEYLTEIARLDKEVQRELEAEGRARREADESRAAAQNIVRRLSELFHIVVQSLIPDDPLGRVVLTESAITPDITWHGELTSAAMESLKVVAFDLAALLLTMEGKTELPGFLLHDSPREADLGLVIYHRIFELVLWLESKTDVPQFQYVITTTTAPPDKLQVEPWRILELSSAPTQSRLFMRDL